MDLCDGGPFGWDEIQNVLDGTTPLPRCMSGQVQPDRDPRPCEFCGKPTSWLDWANGPLNWRSSCGQAGFVEVCFDCHAWFPAEIYVMS